MSRVVIKRKMIPSVCNFAKYISGLMCAVWLTRVVSTQKTYRRGCKCEYMVNGECAYTLLLPAPTNDGAYCPKDQNPNINDIHQIQSDLNSISGNLTSLLDWQGDISRQVNLIHEVLIVKDYNLDPNKTAVDALTDRVRSLAQKTETASQTALFASQTAETVQTRLSDALRTLDSIQADYSAIRTELASLRKEAAILRETGCTDRDLLVSGTRHNISDTQILVSSIYNPGHGAEKVRVTWNGTPGAWCPREPNEPEEWLMFDLGQPKTVFGVVTRGRSDYTQWVTSYKLQYADTLSGNETSWQPFTDVLGAEQIFQGNSDQQTVQTNMLWRAFTARYIRIIPLTAYNNSNKCMRADLIGCMLT